MSRVPLWPVLGLGVVGLGVYGLLARDARAATPTPAQLLPLRLASAPFPDAPQPGAVVVIPAGFNPTRPCRLCFYFHGHHNSALNVVGSGGGSRPASHLAEQLALSPDVLLVVPGISEVDSAIGQLSRPGRMLTFIQEVLGQLPRVNVGHVIAMAHSGGYLGAAALVEASIPLLRSVVLLDALYGEVETFAAWAQRGGRLASVYTASGGTATNSGALAGRVAGLPGALIDPSTAPVSVEALSRARAVVKRSALSHDAVARHYPAAFWEAGW